MKSEGTGAESAVITVQKITRVGNLKVSDNLFTCRRSGRTVVTGLIMPKLAMVAIKPCSLVSLKKGAEIVPE
jgi:hypothetical protein